MSYLAIIKELEQRQVRYEEAVARILGAESRPPLTTQPGHSVGVPPIQEVSRVA
jgi:hypothetical protein